MTGINHIILYGDSGYVEHVLEYSDMAPRSDTQAETKGQGGFN